MQRHGSPRKIFDAKDGALKLNTPKLNTEGGHVRDDVLKHVWTSYIEDVMDITNLIQTKTEFSNAMAVMVKVDGWSEEGWATTAGLVGTWQCACGCTPRHSFATVKETWNNPEAVNWSCSRVYCRTRSGFLKFL